MPEMIDRRKLLNTLCKECGHCKNMEEAEQGSAKPCSVHRIISEQHTIESEPVRHGRWIPICVSKKGLTDTFKCSECGRTTVTIYKTSKCEKAYCWNCGARMDGGTENV